MESGCDARCWCSWSRLCGAQITQGWYYLQWGCSWNTLVCPNQDLAWDQRWQPFMQYFLLPGNCEYFVYIILNCTQTMCPPQLCWNRTVPKYENAGSEVRKARRNMGRDRCCSVCLYHSTTVCCCCSRATASPCLDSQLWATGRRAGLRGGTDYQRENVLYMYLAYNFSTFLY